jgi:hypothetical protein
MIYMCAAVIVTPEVRSSIVFTRGSPQTSNSCVPKGGHTLPQAMLGTKLKWKKAQKKEKKSITSDTIKRSIPRRRPNCTFFV